MVTTPAFFSSMSSGGATSWADDEMDTTHFMPPPSRSLEASSSVKFNKKAQVKEQRTAVDDDDNQDREVTHEVRPPSREAPHVSPFTGYIGNLPYEITEDDVMKLFANMNIANIRMPMDFRNNRRKGFAYVEFSDRESLINALDFNGKMINSRHIRVDVAEERKPRERRDSMERRTKSSGRTWTPEGNKEAESNGVPKERKRISLLPRTKSTEAQKEEHAARNRAIFGSAKPRDESEYRQRKKSMEEQAAPVATPNVVEKEKSPEKKLHYSKSGGRPRTKSMDGQQQQQQREHVNANPRQRNKPHKINRRKLSDEEIIKKATVMVKKPTTKVENPFSALLSDTDSEDSD